MTEKFYIIKYTLTQTKSITNIKEKKNRKLEKYKLFFWGRKRAKVLSRFLNMYCNN